MKFGIVKILVSVLYPAILLSLSLFVLETIAPEVAFWQIMGAPGIVSFLCIALLGGRYSSPSPRLAIAGIVSTLIFCILFPLFICASAKWQYGPGINFWPMLVNAYIFFLIFYLIPIPLTTTAGIVAGLAYVARPTR